MEHVISYPDGYSPAFAFSAIRYPLSPHVLCSAQTPAALPQGRTTGLPSFTALTRWGGCCLSTGGLSSVCPERLTEHPTACHFGSGAYSYFRLFHVTVVPTVHLRFTRSPSLDPCPPCSWQTPEPILTDWLRRLCRGALSGRFRRFLTDPAAARRLWMTEHPVSATTVSSRRANNQRRDFASLKKYHLPRDSRRTDAPWLFASLTGRGPAAPVRLDLILQSLPGVTAGRSEQFRLPAFRSILLNGCGISLHSRGGRRPSTESL